MKLVDGENSFLRNLESEADFIAALGTNREQLFYILNDSRKEAWYEEFSIPKKGGGSVLYVRRSTGLLLSKVIFMS